MFYNETMASLLSTVTVTVSPASALGTDSSPNMSWSSSIRHSLKWTSSIVMAAGRYFGLPPNSLVHGVDEGLVDSHALLGQAGGAVDGDAGELGVRGPVLVQDQQQPLRSV